MELAKMTEEELKFYFLRLIQDDFHIEEECAGKHLIEGTRVIADYVLSPKMHLLENGFDEGIISVEVKSNVGRSNGIFKANAGCWQAATYGQSMFQGRRPIFSMMFPDPHIFAAADSFSLNPEFDAIGGLWLARSLEHMAQFMNVGFLEVKNGLWTIKIGSQRYYSQANGKGKANLIKRYTGNVR